MHCTIGKKSALDNESENFIRDVVRMGATSAIATVNFGKESQIVPFDHNSIIIIASMH